MMDHVGKRSPGPVLPVENSDAGSMLINLLQQTSQWSEEVSQAAKACE